MGSAYMGRALPETGGNKTAAAHLEIAATRFRLSTEARIMSAESYDHLSGAEDARKDRVTGAQFR